MTKDEICSCPSCGRPVRVVGRNWPVSNVYEPIELTQDTQPGLLQSEVLAEVEGQLQKDIDGSWSLLIETDLDDDQGLREIFVRAIFVVVADEEEARNE